MSDEEKPSIVSGPAGDPRAMWITRSNVDKEAQWAQNKKKIEKPGYSYVRHTTDEYVSGIRNASDGYAWGAMQLNLTDLRSAMGNTDAGFDDTEIQKELAAQAQKIQNNTSEINKLKTGKADKDHTHDDLVGGIYDDSWIQPALDKKSDTTHGHANYSEITHQHDTTHNHDKEYQAKGDYAAEIHGHIEYETKTDANIVHDALTESIAKKADSRHVHDGTYAPFVHEHDLEAHNHDDKYQPKGDYASDVHFHDEYAEKNDLDSLEIKLNEEISDREHEDEKIKNDLANHQHATTSPAQVSKEPPTRPVEGDLWFMSDVFLAEGEIPIELSNDKLFVYADGKWEPATSLQHERRFREIGDLQALEDAKYYTQREDGKHITRMDKAFLPAPVFVDKDVTIHADGVIPPVVDDNLHFSDPISKKWSTIAYKGDDPGPGIYYAIMSHKSNYPSPRREEWIVRRVEYENGIVTITADDPYGCVGGHSGIYPCTLWLLTEEDAASIPYVRSDGDTIFQHEPGRRITRWKTNPPGNPDGTLDTTNAFGITMDLSSGNTYRNQFEVTANGGYIFRALGGSGREMWIGGAIRQKSGDLDNPRPEDYVTRKNLNFETEQMALGLQSISTPRCNGLWQFKGKLSDGAPRDNGEFSLVYDHDKEDNYLTFVTTDLNGEHIDLMSHVQAGDYVQVYDVDNPESYTLHTIDDVLLGSINPEMVEMPCTLVAHGNELVKSDKCAIRFFAVKESPEVAELNARMNALEEAMKPWLGINIGTYATKSSGNYEPTGSSQNEGTADMWWTNVSMNTTPNNHVRIGMQDNPDLCTQIAATPVPFEMDVIQPGAKQTWHVYDVYERGEGVLHVLNDVAWGDQLTHSHLSVDTQYIVRKV